MIISSHFLPRWWLPMSYIQSRCATATLDVCLLILMKKAIKIKIIKQTLASHDQILSNFTSIKKLIYINKNIIKFN